MAVPVGFEAGFVTSRGSSDPCLDCSQMKFESQRLPPILFSCGRTVARTRPRIQERMSLTRLLRIA